MTTTVIANGNTYTDDDNPTTGMGAGGFRERLLPMLGDVMIETNESRALAEAAIVDAEAAADAAAISAASAIGSPNTNGTSSTSLTISNASKALTAQTGKSWVVGMWLTLARSSAPSTAWMNGAITAYNSGTGALTVDVKRSRGTGSATDWVISASAPEVPDNGGATESTVGVVLTTSSNRYQSVQPTSVPGIAVLVPTPTSSTQGADVFVVRNDTDNTGYGQDLLIATASGSPRGYVPPDREASISGVGTDLVLSNARSYGSVLMASCTFSSAVAGTSGLFTKAVYLPSGDVLLLVHGANLHAVVYSVAAGTLGTPVQVRAGLVAAGDDFSVAACLANNGSDDVVVTSINGTAMQNVLLTVSGGVITVNAVLSTTLGSAWIKVLEVQAAGSLSNRFAILGLVSTTSSQMYGMELTGTTLVVGAVVTVGIASSAVVALLPRNSDNVITLLAATTVSNIAARPYTVGASGLLTVGSVANLTVTATTYIAVRYDEFNSNWIVMHVNTTARVAALTVSAAPAAAFSTATVMQSAVTTLTAAYFGGDWNVTDNPTMVVTGTGTGSRPVAELWRFSAGTGVPVPIDSYVTYMDSVPTATYLNTTGMWQLATATEAVMLLPFNAGGAPTPIEWRMPGAGSYAQLAAPLDNTDIKAAKPRNLLRSGLRALTVLDGTKPSMQYNAGGWAEPTSIPVRLINTALNSRSIYGQNMNGTPNLIWAAAGPNPSTTLTIQCLQLV